MRWPLSQDYNEAIQNPSQCFADADLRGCRPVTNALGLPSPCSGNFADVYAVESGSRKWAVKCFTRPIVGLAERYVLVSQHLRRVPLPFMVGFQFLEQGIRSNGHWFPILKMDWVDGLNLNTFVRENLARPDVLRSLADIWLRLAVRLREADVAHGDLQHGNVLLIPGSKAGALAVKLVDYDGLLVPGTESLPTREVGHPAYQHPQRLQDGGGGLEIDRFSHLVIYTALRALIVGGRAIWDRYDNGDNLLFKQRDFEKPEQAEIFAELMAIADPGLKSLVRNLIDAARQPLEGVPSLTQALSASRVACQLLAPVHPFATRSLPQRGAEEPLAPLLATPVMRAKSRRIDRSNTHRWLVIAGVLAAMGGLGVGLLLAFNPQPKSVDEPALANQKTRTSKISMPSDVVKPIGHTEVSHAAPAGSPAGTGQVRANPTISGRLSTDLKPIPRPTSPSRTGESLVMEGHRHHVTSVAVSGDGRLAVSGSRDKSIRLWDLTNGKLVRSLSPHDEGVFTVALSADGRRALSGGGDRERGDNAVRLWDVENGKELLRLHGHQHSVWCAAFLPDGKRAVTAGLDSTVRLWNLDDGAEIRRLETWKPVPGLSAQVWSLAVSADGRRILCGLRSDEAKLIDVETGREIHTFRGRKSSFVSIAISPDGTRGLGASDGREGSDVAVYLWDLTMGKELRRLDPSIGEVHALAFLPDGKRALLGLHHEPDLSVWDIESGKEVRLKGHRGPIRSVTVFAEGREALTASEDGALRLWGLPK